MAVKLGELVLKEGLVTEKQLDEALAHQKEKGTRVGESLVFLGYLSEDDLAACLSKRLGVPLVDLDHRKIDPETLKLVPAAAARMHRVLPLSTSGVVLRIAMVDPTNLFALDDLKFMTGRSVEPFVAPQKRLQEAIERYYGPVDATGKAGPAPAEKREVKEEPSGNGRLTPEDLARIPTLDALDLAALVEEEPEPDEGEIIDLGAPAEGDVPPVVQATNAMLTDCVRRGATDVLIEPYEKEFRIRFRIDGVLYNVAAIPPSLKDPLISRVKTMFRADLSRKHLPQNGVIRVRIGVETRRINVDFLVSCIPTEWGETIHLKRMDRSAWTPLPELGFDAEGLEHLQAALRGQRGMVLLTGQRGSGVSTTFYSAMASVRAPEVNAMTLEPWIEVDLPGVNQVRGFDGKEVSPGEAVTWLSHHDADVLGIADLRDHDTWTAALTASQDAVVVAAIGGGGTASRLVRLRDAQDSKTVPMTFAGALRVVVAQRLVRKVCEGCKAEDEVHVEFLADLGYSEDEVAEATLLRGAGCDACAGTGYRGRVGLFETLVVSPGIRDLLVAGADADRIRRLALEEGMMTLRRSGLDKVKEGITTLEEVLKETED